MVTTRAALRAASAADGRVGLTLDRYFTTQGVHPYDDLEWEHRDAVITDHQTGEVSFEQRGVEFPTSWSMNATTIVAQKYFRGHLGTPGRESSVRHMIDRVADTITQWGTEGGYFADADSAEVFNHELKHLLVTQKAAFNSPVWFNVGVEDTPQCSACFILSVEDQMTSILNWYYEEGIIFKGGSGSGVNLSRIRSSQEKLKGGGEASGPVSFMRGADASAGTIKSGGKTRRAAKMVILDSDHPDIEEFIWCKRDEEQKVRALEAAGYDMSFDSQAMSTVQYQNANNSVRVDDDFMRAVENDETYDLIGRTDGEVKKSVRARDLFREISQAAWECADPGLQYDTTINSWHTTPNAGRINGSNPCSEYMHLDNSACNLASLNLRKFEHDGVFDTEAFTRAVEIVFTAQEIIVGNSSYPTDKIAENARAYRQLGLGYANLGGLLMSQGIAYDSDAGRAWAGAITALMTGHAYRTSAELAKAQGPFAGYEQDREGTLAVLRQHRDALAGIDEEQVPTNLLDAARRSWEEAVELGTEHGVRNAQASVLAPTGCLVGGSLVPTERGLVRLSSLGDPAGSQWQGLDVGVATDDGTRQASHFYVNGTESVVAVETARGHLIQGTPAHRIRVVEPDGSWEWKRFGDLEAGDSVPLAMNTLVGEPQTVSLPPLGEACWTGERHAVAPQAMTPELAELVGYFMGDGSLHAKGLRLSVADGDFEVIDRLTWLGKELFNLEAQTSQQTGHTEVALHSVRLAQWWEAAGFAKDAPSEHHHGTGWRPRIPDAVLHANDRAVYAAFLRGLFEADGTVTVGYPEWTTSSLAFSHDVQSLLLTLGYPTTRRFHTSGRGSQLAVLRLLNTSYHQRWLDEIGFLSDRKVAAVAIEDSAQSARYDRIPMTRELIDRVAPDNDRVRKALLMEHRRHGRASRRIAAEAHAASGDPELGHLLGFFYDEVHSAELGEDELTYDLSVPDNTTYVANGFISHNTIGLMMDCDTTGVEPDLGLVKMKKLVGGGTMRIINQTVPVALAKLGYQPEQVEAIVDYIDKHSTIEGAPGFRDEHLPVFDCAIGERSIAPRGHVRMMGAVQPWISGAISKCVTGETVVPTEDGLVRIGDLHRGERPDTFRDDVRRVASLGEEAKTDGFYYGGVRPVTCVTLRSGHAVTGTENHRLLVVDDQGPSWRFIDDLEPGDHVAVQYGADLWATVPARFDDFVPSPLYGGQKSVRLPEAMSAELAFLLGAYCSEGSIARSTWTVAFSNADDGVLHRIADTIRSVFAVEPRINRPGDRCASVTVTSKTVVEFFEHAGCGAGAANKRIPESVLQSPRDMVLAFLQGLFLDAYATTAGNSPKLALCVRSPQLLDDYQAVLTNLGIVHSRVSKCDPDYDQTYGEVCASGSQAGHLAGLVPFLETEKARRAADLPTHSSPHGSCDVVLDDGLHFSEVVSVEDGGQREVYDLSVPTTHAFVGNGIVNHNTVNMPESATVEDVEEMYFEGWKLGLKAIAIYRDNCKVSQPLAIASSQSSEAEAESEPATTTEQAEQQGMVRRRLPKQRPSQTLSFTVGDAEGYLTAGEYPGDGLGEIFVKLGKQGSTLSGVMDAFAIAVSLGLQYGVPLEAYVKKFVNTRFEPSGITDDREVKFASSLVDYIFRRLAIEYLPPRTRHDIGIYTIAERNAQLEGGHGGEQSEEPVADAEGQTVLPVDTPTHVDDVYGDAPMCLTCGVQMVRAGSCHLCQSCGATSGCS